METCIAMDMRCDDPVLAGRSRPSCLLCSALALRHTPRACRAIALGWAYVHLSPPGPATLRTCTHLSGAPVPGEHAAGMVQLAPTPAMDEVTFRSDTVLSDVHLYTPNQRHLMVRLNGVGQPVFLSQFQLLWSQEASGTRGGDHRDPRPEEPPLARPGSTGSSLGSGHSSEGLSIQAEADSTGQEGVGALLDEDGDLDVVRRPQATSDPDPTGFPRLKVHPMILTQDEDVTGDDAPESSPHSVIRIGVARCPAPGGLHPVPKGPLPRTHRAGAGGGHRTGQHRCSHHGAHRLLYSIGMTHITSRPQQPLCPVPPVSLLHLETADEPETHEHSALFYRKP
ncbi:methyltransferase-like protein 22 isoform X5 [Tupaia chinensis]|uniref:methyltransferase-like protein 22 isoform X5 n=1 Tax=Tupaia chinensis TaxID=246437 RepID=UPI000FFC76C5|nr:methyltransferase-like protein 22 isoform X5 [Tupaia chinensis]